MFLQNDNDTKTAATSCWQLGGNSRIRTPVIHAAAAATATGSRIFMGQFFVSEKWGLRAWEWEEAMVLLASTYVVLLSLLNVAA